MSYALDQMHSHSDHMSLQELADSANRWCEERGVSPINGQAAAALNERSIRYYRTLGLLDAPHAGNGKGYRERHLLQLLAIRILQAQGLPLKRIQELLYGRTIQELREIRRRAAPVQRCGESPEQGFSARENWQVFGVTPNIALLVRTGPLPTAEQIAAIREILACHKPESI